MPYRICKTIEIENGHMLSKHPDKCRFPHGHTRKVEIVLEADELDANEMVCDFKVVRTVIEDYLETLDHALCVNTADPMYETLREAYGGRVIGFEEEDPTTEVLARVGGWSEKVIATGGGIVIREENRAVLKDGGFVIWLRASPEAIYDRCMRNQNRPLLDNDDPLGTITKLLGEREGLYRETADFEVNTSDLTVDEIVHGITESARIAFSKAPAG